MGLDWSELQNDTEKRAIAEKAAESLTEKILGYDAYNDLQYILEHINFGPTGAISLNEFRGYLAGGYGCTEEEFNEMLGHCMNGSLEELTAHTKNFSEIIGEDFGNLSVKDAPVLTKELFASILENARKDIGGLVEKFEGSKGSFTSSTMQQTDQNNNVVSQLEINHVSRMLNNNGTGKPEVEIDNEVVPTIRMNVNSGTMNEDMSSAILETPQLLEFAVKAYQAEMRDKHASNGRGVQDILNGRDSHVPAEAIGGGIGGR